MLKTIVDVSPELTNFIGGASSQTGTAALALQTHTRGSVNRR